MNAVRKSFSVCNDSVLRSTESTITFCDFVKWNSDHKWILIDLGSDHSICFVL